MRAKKNILNDVRGIGPDDYDLILEVWDFCSKKSLDPQEEFWKEINEDRRSKLDKRSLELMNTEPEGDDNKRTAAQIRQDFVEEFMDPHFKVVQTMAGRNTYRVVDLKREILEPITNDADEAVLSKGLQLAEKAWGSIVDENFVKACVGRFRRNPAAMNEVPGFKLPHEKGWCIFRPIHTPNDDEADNIPMWQDVLDRMTDPDAFLSWVWGVYSGDYEGRLILWVYGKDGEEGKSAISSVISKELFGPSAVATSNDHLGASNKQFLFSTYEGARLVIYPDCNVRTLIMHEAFKSLASGGSDPVLIEHKGKTPYTATLNAYAWVSSNKKPVITNDGFVKSRTLPIQMFAPTGDRMPRSKYYNLLKDELPGFLALARATYEAFCTDHYHISINDETKAMIADQVDDSNEEFDIVFDKYFQVDPQGRVSAEYLREKLMKERFSTYDVDDFLRYLGREHDATKKRDKIGLGWFGISRRSGAANVVQFKPKGGKSKGVF